MVIRLKLQGGTDSSWGEKYTGRKDNARCHTFCLFLSMVVAAIVVVVVVVVKVVAYKRFHVYLHKIKSI
jgi:t-SNARE complex subunit (syntaxin)